MVVVQLNGGLGNQMFQYAAAKSLSLHHNVPLSLDVSLFYRENLPDLEVPRNFELYNFKGVNEKMITPEELESIAALSSKKNALKKFIPRYKQSIYTEPYYHFDKNFLKSKNKVLLKGGWQSEKYFMPHIRHIQETFKMKDELIRSVKNKAGELKELLSVAVHIRRADYLRKKIIFEWHGVMGKEYYSRAFQVLDEKLQDYKVFYFTDDPGWVEKELIPLKNGELISKDVAKNHLEDFYLMSQCQHNIIANSSFSWWAAWLNNNLDKIVVAPKNWFNKGPKDTQDLLPASWIKI